MAHLSHPFPYPLGWVFYDKNFIDFALQKRGYFISHQRLWKLGIAQPITKTHATMESDFLYKDDEKLNLRKSTDFSSIFFTYKFFGEKLHVFNKSAYHI